MCLSGVPNIDVVLSEQDTLLRANQTPFSLLLVTKVNQANRRDRRGKNIIYHLLGPHAFIIRR